MQEPEEEAYGVMFRSYDWCTATDNRSTGVNGSSVNSDLAVSLTRNDIPMIVQDITRQLCPENNRVNTSPPTSLVPSRFINF